MSEVRTAAGKALLDMIDRASFAQIEDGIAAIEAEAREQVILAHDAWSMAAVREWLASPEAERRLAAALADWYKNNGSGFGRPLLDPQAILAALRESQ